MGFKIDGTIHGPKFVIAQGSDSDEEEIVANKKKTNSLDSSDDEEIVKTKPTAQRSSKRSDKV